MKLLALLLGMAVITPALTMAEAREASIRMSPNQSSGRTGFMYTLPDGQLTARGLTLRALIFEAFDLHGDGELVGGADWMNTVHWDLDAKPEGGEKESMPTLRTLLQGKFSLKVHWETRELSGIGSIPARVLVVDSVQKPSEK
jgi:uncharacterized protein (TIGR03435 family)